MKDIADFLEIQLIFEPSNIVEDGIEERRYVKYIQFICLNNKNCWRIKERDAEDVGALRIMPFFQYGNEKWTTAEVSSLLKNYKIETFRLGRLILLNGKKVPLHFISELQENLSLLQ